MQIETQALVTIVWAVLSGFCVLLLAIIGFFLRSIYASAMHRLDSLEKIVTEALGELKAGNIITTTNSQEIALLRTRQHDLSNEFQILKSIQQRCKHCNGL
jgi:hypothetical protein